MTHSVSKSGIFASPTEKKKAYLLLSFISLITIMLAGMTELLPKGSNITPSFILNFYVLSTTLILVYSLFTQNPKNVRPVSMAIMFWSVVYAICNFYVDYEKDYRGMNFRIQAWILIAIMFIVSVARFLKYRTK